MVWDMQIDRGSTTLLSWTRSQGRLRLSIARRGATLSDSYSFAQCDADANATATATPTATPSVTRRNALQRRRRLPDA